VHKARQHGILVDAGSMYFSDPVPDVSSICVGFGAIPHTRIAAGMELLASIATTMSTSD
jgi:DNA-binding transcriptional MocR family regulator